MGVFLGLNHTYLEKCIHAHIKHMVKTIYNTDVDQCMYSHEKEKN